MNTGKLLSEHPLLRHILKMVVVDLIDDLQMPGQDVLEHGGRPALKGLRQDRVIGVGTDARGQAPGLGPREAFNVEEDSHQLRDRHGRVSVVQLDGHLTDENKYHY